MRNINCKHYGQLSPQERTNLTVLALARNDTQEADRLLDTCPKYTYRAHD